MKYSVRSIEIKPSTGKGKKKKYTDDRIKSRVDDKPVKYSAQIYN